MTEFSLAISILPVVLIGSYIYNKDREKEPTKLLTKLFIGGIGSCFLVLFVSSIVWKIFPIFKEDPTGLNLKDLLFYVFVGIAFIEEFCKWIMAYKISYDDKDFDELYDAILYSAFVALGFACFENLLYVYKNGVGVGIIRAFSAVPSHAVDGIWMGYYLGLSKVSSLNNNNKLKNKNLFLSILVPTLLHGIYDYCLLTGKFVFLIFFFIFVILMYVYAIRKVKKISSLTRKMKYKYNFCPNCGHAVVGNYCPTCGKKNE